MVDVASLSYPSQYRNLVSKARNKPSHQRQHGDNDGRENGLCDHRSAQDPRERRGDHSPGGRNTTTHIHALIQGRRWKVKGSLRRIPGEIRGVDHVHRDPWDDIGTLPSELLRQRCPGRGQARAQSGEQRWTFPGNISRQIDIQAVLEAELSKDAPRTIEAIAHSLGYAAARSLRDVAPQMCKHISKKRSDQRRSASLQRKRALSLALREEPAPSLEELRFRLNLRSSDQLRSLDGELCKSLSKRHRMRRVKERDGVRSLIEGCLKQPNPRWTTIEHDTGWVRSLIKIHFPDLYAKAKILCKETWDNKSQSDLNAAEARVRHVVEELLATGIQPSIQNVYRIVPKGPYLGTTWIERILRKIRH